MKKKQRLKRQASTQALTTHEFDRRFEEGSSVLELTDEETATFRVNVDFPVWTVSELDRESTRLGITRQALVKVWIAERLDQLAQARAVGVGAEPSHKVRGRSTVGPKKAG